MQARAAVWESAAGVAAEDWEEAGWIARARAGEAAAFRWLLARYRHRVVRLAAHVLRRPDEAEDAAQEAFVRAFRSLRGYRGDGPFSAWLFRIAVRACRDRQRRARWNAERPVESGEPTPLRTGCEAVEAAELRLVVGTLLDRLSPPMRAALVLRELEGLEYEAIAGVLGIPVGTVRSRLSTARAQFRELWSEAMQELEHV